MRLAFGHCPGIATREKATLDWGASHSTKAVLQGALLELDLLSAVGIDQWPLIVDLGKIVG